MVECNKGLHSAPVVTARKALIRSHSQDVGAGTASPTSALLSFLPPFPMCFSGGYGTTWFLCFSSVVSSGLLFQAHSGKCLRAPSVGAGPQSQAAWAFAGA